VSVTGTSTAALPEVVEDLDPTVAVPPGTTTTTTTTVTPGTGPLPSTQTGSVPAPALAGNQGKVVVAGRTVPAVAALAAFGVWQLLTLSITTLYAFVDRRRRLEEEQV